MKTERGRGGERKHTHAHITTTTNKAKHGVHFLLTNYYTGGLPWKGVYISSDTEFEISNTLFLTRYQLQIAS